MYVVITTVYKSINNQKEIHYLSNLDAIQHVVRLFVCRVCRAV